MLALNGPIFEVRLWSEDNVCQMSHWMCIAFRYRRGSRLAVAKQQTALLQDINFDLVISGINRGDNCGLHVIYSGTVGAAREAACKVVTLSIFLEGLPHDRCSL